MEIQIAAFYGKQELKDALVAQLEQHYAANETIKGQGCAVGCFSQGFSHETLAETFGIPLELCYLFDSIFEGLENSLAKEFPLKFIKSIPVGADLSKAWNRFAVWLLVDPTHGVSRFNRDPSIDAVAKLHQAIIDGLIVQPQAWAAASDDAEAAVLAAALAAAVSAVSARTDADTGAADAAWAAADAAGAAAARAAADARTAAAAWAAADAAWAAAGAAAADTAAARAAAADTAAARAAADARAAAALAAAGADAAAAQASKLCDLLAAS